MRGLEIAAAGTLKQAAGIPLTQPRCCRSAAAPHQSSCQRTTRAPRHGTCTAADWLAGPGPGSSPRATTPSRRSSTGRRAGTAVGRRCACPAPSDSWAASAPARLCVFIADLPPQRTKCPVWPFHRPPAATDFDGPSCASCHARLAFAPAASPHSDPPAAAFHILPTAPERRQPYGHTAQPRIDLGAPRPARIGLTESRGAQSSPSWRRLPTGSRHPALPPTAPAP